MAKDTCSIEGCGGTVASRGWCSTHYSRWLRTGTTTLDRPPLHRLSGVDPERRFATCSVCGPQTPVKRNRSGWTCYIRAKRSRQSGGRTWNGEEAEKRALVIAQAGRCAICGEPMRRPYLDHDHDTGAIRGVLCPSCNTGLGYFRDEAERLEAAAAYLREQPAG